MEAKQALVKPLRPEWATGQEREGTDPFRGLLPTSVKGKLREHYAKVASLLQELNEASGREAEDTKHRLAALELPQALGSFIC